MSGDDKPCPLERLTHQLALLMDAPDGATAQQLLENMRFAISDLEVMAEHGAFDQAPGTHHAAAEPTGLS